MNTKTTASAKKSVLIVDDHPAMRHGLTEIFNQQSDLRVCGAAATAAEARDAVRALQPDLVLMDVTLGEDNGLELVKDLKVQVPGLPVLALSMHDESLYAERLLRAGALGYIMKAEPIPRLLQAIRKVLRGEMYVSERMANHLLRAAVKPAERTAATPVERLSDRELEVFELLGRGHSCAEIAAQLHLSRKTISAHRENIKRKLDLTNHNALVHHAVHWVSTHHAQ
jgi:DNA-binding NarL/FixJ family response regulator